MNNFLSVIKKITVRITWEHCAIRFIMAWCFVSFLKLIYLESRGVESVVSLAGMRYVGFGWMAAAVAVCFVFLYMMLEVLDNELYERLFLFLLTLPYAVASVTVYRNIWFCIAVTALMGLVAAYVFQGVRTAVTEMNVHIYRTCIAAAGVLFVIFTGGCTVLRYFTYSAPNFDCGLFSQMFHYMKTTFTMNVTSERDMLLSHMCVHISPVFWLLLPFYALVPSPATLQFMQAVVVASGLVPLSLICRKLGLSRLEGLMAAICYSAYPVMSGGCFYDIHENCFLPCFLLWLLYFVEKNSLPGILASAVFVFGIKEDAAVYVAFVAIYMVLGRKMYKKGALLFMLSLAYFMFAVGLLGAIGEGAMTGRFNNMIYESDGNMLGIVKSIFSNPAYLVTQIMREDNIKFIIQVFGPLLFMPFFTKKWQRFVLFGPLIMFNLMSDYQYFHSIFFQYVFGSGTLLLYVALLNAADLKDSFRSRVFPMLAISSCLFFVTVMWGQTAVVKRWTDSYERSVYAQMDEALDLIPKEASVTATTFLCAALSDHDILYELIYTDEKTEYIALDLRAATTEYSADTYLSDARYETVCYKPFCIAVFRDRTWDKDRAENMIERGW